MNAVRKYVFAPLGIVPAVKYDGPYGPPRKRLMELSASSLDAAQFQGLKTKRRRRSNLLKLWAKCAWYELEEVESPLDLTDELIYYYDDTTPETSPPDVAGPVDEDLPVPPEPQDPSDCSPFLVSTLDIIDDMDPKHKGRNVMFVTKDGKMVAYKLSRRDRGRITLKNWRKHHKTLEKAVETQRNNPRGIRKAGCYIRYVLFGFRREGNKKIVSEYVAKKTKSKKKQKIEERRKRAKEARDGIKELMRQLEKVGLNWVADCDLSVQNKLREVDCLGDVLINGYKGRFSQMAIATGYWSPLHTDDDVFRTLLSCYCKKKMNTKKKDDILFYFVFPSVGIAIPMRSTDILVFDSKFPHCASNYRCDDTFIFSCFTSAKTTNAHLANNASIYSVESGPNNAKEKKVKK